MAKTKKPEAKPAPKSKKVAKPVAKAKPAAKTVATPKKAVAKPAPAKAPPKKAAAPAPKTAAAKAKVAKSTALVATVDDAGLAWIDAGKGYQVTLEDGKLAARNDKGKRLSSVPKEIKDGDLADQLEALRDWLTEHERECLATVELWMLRSLAVPRTVLQAVWEDVAWRKPLENAVVVAVRADGSHDPAKAGLFRGADPKKGVGIVDLDGETGWLDTDRVAIPHPILISELDAWRELIGQLGVVQGIAQLHRETHVKTPEQTAATSIDAFEEGKFAMLMHAIGKARQLGYKVRGGFATCKTWDAGAVDQYSAPLRGAARPGEAVAGDQYSAPLRGAARPGEAVACDQYSAPLRGAARPGEAVACEARYWIGADSPDAVTFTGQLSWVDSRERGLKLADVGPVAFSEGMRMAASIYAARVVEKAETP